MRQAVTDIKLVFCLVLLTAGRAFTQTIVDKEGTDPATSAYVYVQTSKGIEAYSSTSAGTLTLVKDSPFPVIGQIAAVTGQHLISVGTTYLHAYLLAADGAIGEQIDEINTAAYPGGECGPTTGHRTLLDHSGKYFYVLLNSSTAAGNCAALQSYEINSSGKFKFLGKSTPPVYVNNGIPYAGEMQALSHEDDFIYEAVGKSDSLYGISGAEFAAMKIGVNHVAEPINPNFQLPGITGFGDEPYDPTLMTAVFSPDVVAGESFDALVSAMWSINSGGQLFNQLAVFQVQPDGSLATRDQWYYMPDTPNNGNIDCMNASWDGEFMATGGVAGLQIFVVVDGLEGLTVQLWDSPSVDGKQIDQVKWDKNDNLYALSYASGQIFVYHGDPAPGLPITQVPGSPFEGLPAYGISGLIVVPR
jgi:hypothetical protein